MNLVDIWESKSKPTISFEFFPARTEKAAGNLEKTIDKLAASNPDFVSVTFGAGGSTREGSLKLVRSLKQDRGLEVVAYFAGYGLSPQDVVGVLEDYRVLGVDNILVVRGDPPKEEFEPHPDSLRHASDLVTFIKPQFDFCLGVAGYPEGHIEAKSEEKDLEYLKLKIDQGAEYIITNYCYDNKYFFDFVERCHGAGITVPILAGVMPIYSVKMLEMLAGLCGATITDEVRQGIAKLPEDDRQALVDFGIEFALKQCRELLRAGVPGLHFYTMDRSKSTVAIVTALKDERLL
jgi:methylenetetrahydrofolate reductase (NADPH)